MINPDELELQEKLVYINRVSKTVAGGRRMGFTALMVVGDGDGHVGFGHARAKEVPDAIRKATEIAKRSLSMCPGAARRSTLRWSGARMRPVCCSSRQAKARA